MQDILAEKYIALLPLLLFGCTKSQSRVGELQVILDRITDLEARIGENAEAIFNLRVSNSLGDIRQKTLNSGAPFTLNCRIAEKSWNEESLLLKELAKEAIGKKYADALQNIDVNAQHIVSVYNEKCSGTQIGWETFFPSDWER